eukprot:911868-Amphidinium_carterae.2
MGLLHRVLRCCPETWSVELECDQRHVAKERQELKLDPRTDRSRDSQADKLGPAELHEAESSTLLNGASLTQYRSVVMCTAYLNPERPDLLECSKTLASYMSAPRERHFNLLSRVGRYLIGALCLVATVAVYRPQESPSHIIVVVDSDFAGTADGRRSTSG